jgi:hypothetical protein
MADSVSEFPCFFSWAAFFALVAARKRLIAIN